MPQKTPIQWTDYTSNPIRARHKATGKIGHACIKVSDGCKNCYAERMNKWRGTGEPFTPAGMGNVELFLDAKELARLETFKPRGPFKAGGKRAMVFPFDMTDLFQEGVSSPDIQRFLQLVEKRRDIIWQVLTKRPVRALHQLIAFGRVLPNLWLGFSAENQMTFDDRYFCIEDARRLVGLLFLSAEPMLGPIRLWDEIGVDWVICGGESGRGTAVRSMQLAWALSLRDQCRDAGVPFFMKQVGAKPLAQPSVGVVPVMVLDSHGGNMEEWPEDLRIRQWPTAKVLT